MCEIVDVYACGLVYTHTYTYTHICIHTNKFFYTHSLTHSLSAPSRIFKPVHPFDTYGIMYHLGTNGNTTAWKNPGTCHVCVYVCMYVCMYVRMYVCV